MRETRVPRGARRVLAALLLGLLAQGSPAATPVVGRGSPGADARMIRLDARAATSAPADARGDDAGSADDGRDDPGDDGHGDWRDDARDDGRDDSRDAARLADARDDARGGTTTDTPPDAASARIVLVPWLLAGSFLEGRDAPAGAASEDASGSEVGLPGHASRRHGARALRHDPRLESAAASADSRWLDALGVGLSRGPRVRPGDVIATDEIALDLRLELTWRANERVQLGAGYELAYMGAPPAGLARAFGLALADRRPATVEHGPWLGAWVDF